MFHIPSVAKYIIDEVAGEAGTPPRATHATLADRSRLLPPGQSQTTPELETSSIIGLRVGAAPKNLAGHATTGSLQTPQNQTRHYNNTTYREILDIESAQHPSASAAMGFFTTPTSYRLANPFATTNGTSAIATNSLTEMAFGTLVRRAMKPPAHSSHPPLGHLILLVFEAVMEVVCVSLPGYIIARQGMFDASQQKFVANLNVALFTPCLSKINETQGHMCMLNVS